MQQKINTLLRIISEIKISRKRNDALSIINDMVKVINGQEDEILALSAWKTDNKKQDIECELEKYVLILIASGFSQKLIRIIRVDALNFIAKYKKEFVKLKPEEYKTVDLWLMNYELAKGEFPKSFKEFKEYYDKAKS